MRASESAVGAVTRRLPVEADQGRPISLAHLARQTMGDRSLEQEVLKLFVKQALAGRDSILAATGADRRRLAHGLKGSARSVGAFALADCLQAIEDEPTSARDVKRVAPLVQEVCDFVAAISR
jgi:HPt (histidine-containing phosphotransfer) domain-containing protein